MFAKCRNKGFGFIHFATDEAADDFVEKVQHSDNTRRNTSTTLAQYQGVTANLVQFLTAAHKRTSTGSVHVVCDGKLEACSVTALRHLHKERAFA